MAMINVTIDDNWKDRLDEVAQALQAGGMVVEQKMSRLGVITGQADEQNISRLQQIPGVLSISTAKKAWATAKA